jgi:hypothetical protein
LTRYRQDKESSRLLDPLPLTDVAITSKAKTIENIPIAGMLESLFKIILSYLNSKGKKIS